MNGLMEFAKEVHENAVAHGWWEQPREEYGIRALIHDEWSEALEAARKGMPLVYMEGTKPEGIAVELMDGCIRILDYLAWCNEREYFSCETAMEAVWAGRAVIVMECGKEAEDVDVEQVVDLLHDRTAMSRGGYGKCAYMIALGVACAWVEARGLDPMALMRQKHEYNLGREYKHGKLF